jgi:hypothetical protein
MTNSAGGLLPHPDAEWYDRTIGTSGLEYFHRATPEQRRSYVRFILAGHGGERSQRLDELADWDPAAVAPWADHAADFDDAAIDQLGHVEPVGYWRACAGASEAAVDRLAARIASAPPAQMPSAYVMYQDDPAQARVELLAGADTDHSLLRLAELARTHESVRATAELHGVRVPDTGPGVRRYVPRPVDLTYTEREPDHRLLSFPPAGGVLADPRGSTCALPLVVPLDLDLSVLPGDPLAGARTSRHRFLAGICDDCNESWWEPYTWRSAADGTMTLDLQREQKCAGSEGTTPPDPATALVVDRLGRYHPDHDRRLGRGRLGGRPHWMQTWQDWPACCGRPMFYVGQLSLADYGGSGVHMYGFHCECGTGTQIPQVLL